MTNEAYQAAKQTLLTTINHCAPNGKVQRAFVTLLHEMEAEDNHDTNETKNCSILRRLVGSLYDGLAYGNWIGEA